MAELKKTLCNRDCPDVCRIVATVENGKVTKLAGDPDHPVTQGFLCHRTSQFLKLQYSPDRITTPLLRKNGELSPVGWDEALDFAADKLTRIRDESGGASILHYRSGGSLGMLKMLSDHFFEKFGPCAVKRGDICTGAGDAAQMLDFGDEDCNDLFDLHHSRTIVLWGKNVFTSSPHTIPVVKEAQSRGAKIWVIDPIHNKTVSIADRYLQPRPGGDFALAMAVARSLFDHAWIAPDAASFCDNLDDFRALANSRSLAEWCREADVAEADAVELARLLGVERPASILCGWGMARRSNGAAIIRALDALGAVTGNVGVRGGGVAYWWNRRRAFDASWIRANETAPRSVLEPLLGREILEAKEPPIRAVWITCGNPVAMLPESETTARALKSRELVVVADSFLTDTARCATLVLPTTTLLEADDLLGAYGHHFVGVAQPVVPPPLGVKSDLEIIQALAGRVGLGAHFAGTARDWKERFTKPKLEPKGVTLEQLERAPLRSPMSGDVAFEDRKFPTPSGKVNLIVNNVASDADDVEFPLVLMSMSTERSQSSQWVKVPEGPAIVTVHPDAARGLADGALARLESRVGAMDVRVKHDERQRRDVAIVPKGGHLHRGQCANALIRARTTDMGEGAALHERVRLVQIDTAKPIAG